MVGLRIAGIGCAVLAATACSWGERRQAPSAAELKAKCLAQIPPGSTGRRPAGTKEDPFIGYGVLIGLKEFSTELTRIAVAQKEIPYFKNAAEWGAYVPSHFMKGINSGDFIKLFYARLSEDSPLGRQYAKVLAERGDQRLPHVFCGYELFKIAVVPDHEVRQTSIDSRE